MAVTEKQRVRFGPFEVDLHSGELFRDSIRLKLQPQPIQVLGILLEHPGELVTRDELRKRLWPEDTFVDFEQGLNTAIKKLRLALGDEAETPRYIETLPRRGYRFLAEITQLTPTFDPGVVTLLPDPPMATVATPAPVATVPSQKLRVRLIIAAAILVALSTLCKLSYRELFPMPPRIVGSRQLTRTRLQKTRGCYLATDGSRVYFQEHRGGQKWMLAQVATDGGEISDIPSPGNVSCLLGISPTGSELLTIGFLPIAMTVPLPTGPAHRLPLPDLGHWVVLSPDGNSFLYSANNDHDMFRGSIDGKTQTRLFSLPNISYPRISPDGTRIRFTVILDNARQRNIWEAGIDGSDPHPLFPELKGQTSFGDWTADGKLFFFFRTSGTSNTLWAVREHSNWFALPRPQPTLLYAGPLEIQSPVSSKGGKELYAIGSDLRGELNIYDPQTETFVPYLGGIPASYITFSPDRQWIAFVSYPDGTLWKSRIDGREKTQLTFSPMGVLAPRWSPDGKFIAFSEWFAGEHHAIYVVPAEGGQPRLLLSGPFEPADPTWSPDSRYIAYGGACCDSKLTHVEVLDLETMQSTKVSGSDGMYSPRWSPDGRHLVAVTLPGFDLMLYSVARKHWQPFPDAMGSPWPAWSHDSKYVYAYWYGKIVRTNIATNTVEVAASVEGIPATNFPMRWLSWFDLTPDDRIVTLRDTGTEDIYALQLEY